MMIWCSLESFTFSEEPCSYPGGNRYGPLAFACATSPVCSLAEIISGGPWLVKTIFEDTVPGIKDGNISGANQPLCANHANFNMGHRINIQEEGRREWEGGFAKVWLPNPRWAVKCKITQIPHAPWMLIRWPRLEFARKGWLAPDCLVHLFSRKISSMLLLFNTLLIIFYWFMNVVVHNF